MANSLLSGLSALLADRLLAFTTVPKLPSPRKCTISYLGCCANGSSSILADASAGCEQQATVLEIVP